jgi:hypothetical protein
LVAFILLLNLALADQGASVPEPAPTDAVKVSGRQLEVEGSALKEQGIGPARYAALLDGYGQFLKHGLRSGLFSGGWGTTEAGFRLYRIDGDHPAPDMVSWLTRSKVTDEKEKDERRVLVMESPPLGTLATADPFLRSMFTQDVDGNGLSDMVGMGYDGCVYLLQSPGSNESKVVGRSESFAVFELVSGPGFERVRAVLPQDVKSIELLESGQARVLLELESLEMANGLLLGRSVERREVLVSLDNTRPAIRFSISEPPDFARLTQPEVEIRGNAISEEILENAEIRHNGEVAWQSPQGIGIRALQINLARTLVPGWNNFQITARNQEGLFQLRELWVAGPADAPAVFPIKKRAVLVSLDDKLREGKLLESLAKAGFPPERVTILEGERATGEAFISSVRNSQGAEGLLVYCESLSIPGALVEGKTLRFADREVAPSEIAQALESGRYKKVVGLFHTETPRAMRATLTPEDSWRDTTTFLDRLGFAGRLMLGNLEDFERGPSSQRKRSRERLRKALDAPQGDDLDRLLDRRNPEETVFRGWMYGGPVVGR